MARAKLTIDLDAIAANWLALDAATSSKTKTAAVVKADAYGLGLQKVAPVLRAAGAETFFVAIAEEGAELREILGAGPDIYVFSGLMEGDAALCKDHALIPLLNSLQQFKRHNAEMQRHRFGVQLDTGMNRLGLELDDVAQISDYLQKMPPRLIISHLACSDEPTNWQNFLQLNVFRSMCEMLPDVPRSLSATGGIFLGHEFHYDMTRPGVGLYGGLPFASALPVVSLKLPVIQSRNLERGESVGYGGTWVADKASRVATISSGYADGLIRKMGGKAVVYAGNAPCPVIGRVSMDMLGVDVSHLSAAPESLQILGPYQSIDQLAAASDTIGYEILTSLGARYERVYKG